MHSNIDLEYFFSPPQLRHAYFSYKESKTDRYDPSQIRIPEGADGVDFQAFESDLTRNIHEVSRRVLSGRYVFYPLREVEIPKPLGKSRTLSVARIRDVLVQKQLYNALYARSEDWFSRPGIDTASVAYRRGKSAHKAIQGIWNAYRDGFEWVVDADIRQFFDRLNHDRMLDVLELLIGDGNSIAFALLRRYLKTDYIPFNIYKDMSYEERKNLFRTQKPQRQTRTLGVPQGGVLSGMMANLYLYAFDVWVVQVLGQSIPLRYFRYADDFVVLTRDQKCARQAFEKIEMKLAEELMLEIHPIGSKSKILNITDEGLEFVGFQVTQRHIRVRPANIIKFKKNFQWSINRIKKHSTDENEKLLEELVFYYVNSIVQGPTGNCQMCGKPLQRRNWISFFAPVLTDLRQIKKLDGWIRRTINHFMFQQYGSRIRNRQHLRSKELASLMQEYNRCKGGRFCRCDNADTDSEI